MAKYEHKGSVHLYKKKSEFWENAGVVIVVVVIIFCIAAANA